MGCRIKDVRCGMWMLDLGGGLWDVECGIWLVEFVFFYTGFVM